MSILPTKRTSGKLSVAEIRMLVYGPPKIGKTTLLSGFPHVLILATEKGYLACQVHVVDIKTWEGFKATVKEILKGKHEFKTIGIDTTDILWKLCVEHVCGDLGIDHMSDEDWGKGYDAVATEFERELNKLFMSKYGLILVSHTKIQDLNQRFGKLSKVTTTLSNQARRIIIPKVDIIGLMKIKTVKKSDGSYADRRVVSFKASELEESGDRTGRLPDELRVFKDSAKTYAVFEEHFAGDKRKGGDVESKKQKRE